MTEQLVGRRVKVHLNLHRGDFTISPTSGGKVLANVDDVTITDVRFHVSESMRQRWCVDKGIRKVHAWAIGTVTAVNTDPDISGRRRLTYNPFRSADFTVDGEPVTGNLPEVCFRDRSGWVS